MSPHNERQFLGVVRCLMNINMVELNEAERENIFSYMMFDKG